MIAYEQNRQKLLQLFQTVIDFVRERKNNDTVQYLAKVMQHLSEGQLYVVVCGEFKQGKSSFINALLNEKEDLCPVDVDVTTSVVTTIAYGETEKITVLLGEAGEEPTEKKNLKSRDQIRDYVTEKGNPRNHRKVRILAIQIPNEQVKSGLVLVDTPGVGGLNTEHTDVTYSFLPNADVALFVSDAHEPLSELELNFIKDRIDRHCPDILFIVTKKDQNAQFQVIVEDNRQKLATKLNRPPDKITIIPVSNLLKRDYLEFQDEDALSASNFSALDTQLWKHLNDGRGRILQLKAGIELGKSLGELRLPIQAELTACQEEDKQRLDEMEKKMQAMNKRLQDMLEKNPQWHNLLQDRLQDIHARISDEFRQGFAEIKQGVNKYLNDRALRGKPEQIVSLLQADMGGLLAELQKSLEKDAETLQEVLGKETGLGLNPYRDAIAANASIALPRQIDTTRLGLWSKGLEVARNATSTGVAGGTLLGLLGGVVGGTIGLFAGGIGAIPGAYWGALIGGSLGQIAGMATGTRRTIQQMGQKERAEIAQFLLNFVAEQEANLGGKLAVAIRDMERFLRDDFTDQLTREKRSVEEAQAGVRNARQLNQNQSAARIAALVVQKRRLDFVQQELDKIMQAAIETVPGLSSQNGAQSHSGDDGTTKETWADE
jgi:predicted GTPase